MPETPITQPTPISGGTSPELAKLWSDIELAGTTTLNNLEKGWEFYQEESAEADQAQKASEPGAYRSIANRMNAAGGSGGAALRGHQQQERSFAERRLSRENALKRHEGTYQGEKAQAQAGEKAKLDETNSKSEGWQREQAESKAKEAATAQPPATAPPAGGRAPAPPGYEWVKMPGGSYDLMKQDKSLPLKYTGGLGKPPGYRTF